MNGRIDVIEVLRLANPVPPGSIDEVGRLSAERASSLHVVPTDVPVTWLEADGAQPRRVWPKYAAAIAAVAAGVAALVLVPRWVDRDAWKPQIRFGRKRKRFAFEQRSQNFGQISFTGFFGTVD